MSFFRNPSGQTNLSAADAEAAVGGVDDTKLSRGYPLQGLCGLKRAAAIHCIHGIHGVCT